MQQQKKRFFELIRFGLVGVMNTAVDAGAYFLLTLIPFFAENYLIAQVISYTLGALNSLIVNKTFTFRDKSRLNTRRIVLFAVVTLVALGVSSAALALCKEVLGWNNLFSKGAAVVVGIGVNFVGNKLFVFPEKKEG